MDPEAAQLVLGAILAIGAGVWLTGLQFLAGSSGTVKAGQDHGMVPDLQPSSQSRLTGYAEVQGQPGVLAAKAASILAKASSFGPIKIAEKTDNRITFERLGPGMVNQPSSRWFRRGELRFTSVGQGRCRVEWTAELANMGWLLAWGSAIPGLGPACVGDRRLGDLQLRRFFARPGGALANHPDVAGGPLPLASVSVRSAVPPGREGSGGTVRGDGQ